MVRVVQLVQQVELVRRVFKVRKELKAHQVILAPSARRATKEELDQVGLMVELETKEHVETKAMLANSVTKGYQAPKVFRATLVPLEHRVVWA